jgi:hypothetical protein
MVNRIDLNTIKEAYRNMGDEKIFGFARDEGVKLSTDAYLLLKSELNVRNIGKEILDDIDHQIILQYSLNQKRFEEDVNHELFVSAIEYALNEKKEGKSQYDIYAGLIERGVSEPYANYMTNKLDEWAHNLHKDAVTDLQAAVAILVAGFVVLYITLKIDRFEISAAFIILIGIMKIILSLDRRRKYKKIVDNFKIDE